MNLARAARAGPTVSRAIGRRRATMRGAAAGEGATLPCRAGLQAIPLQPGRRSGKLRQHRSRQSSPDPFSGLQAKVDSKSGRVSVGTDDLRTRPLALFTV